MRPGAMVLALAGLLVTAQPGWLQGDDKIPEAERIARLIEQLGHDQFAKREAASEELDRIGVPAFAALRKAVADTADAEVRFRAKCLMEAIEQRAAFDGKGLIGWEGLMEYWKVEGGAIIGSTPKALDVSTFLCTKARYRDFELSFQVKLDGGKGNSGVQIRSEIANVIGFTVKGPQCDIGAGFWGCLYGEQFGGMMSAAPKDLVDRVVKKDDFNDYHIRCVGKRVTIKLNGMTTVNEEFANLPDDGIIALQLHNEVPMTVTFKNFKFTNLSK
jgi:hypothetical protein